jgi:DNA-binding XRE family transcriptional regulator
VNKVHLEEFKRIRDHAEFTQSEMAKFLGFATAQAVKNIEAGQKQPGTLVAKLLMYLDSLPKSKAKAFVKEFNKYEPKQKEIPKK